MIGSYATEALVTICLQTLSNLGQLHGSDRTSMNKSLQPLLDGLEPTL